MKLISMTDFVLDQYEKTYNYDDFRYGVLNYAEFLKQPLKLEMFVPCDEYGNVLEKPNLIETAIETQYFHDYKKAIEKILFEGFYTHHTVLFYPNQVAFCDISEWETPNWMNIEWLLNNSFQDLQLTPTAIKQIEP